MGGFCDELQRMTGLTDLKFHRCFTRADVSNVDSQWRRPRAPDTFQTARFLSGADFPT